MEIKEEIEQAIGCGTFTFRGSPRADLFIKERIQSCTTECGVMPTGSEDGDVIYDSTTERALMVSYPVDPIVEQSVLPIGATGQIVVDFDSDHCVEYLNQSCTKVVFSKIVRGMVYHKFAWVEAPE